jgi:GntR family transcriptional regulator, transcriptional repressor for pyruvate dehydrogenase complex
MAEFAPVRRTSVSAAVFDQIAAQILDGRLAPGATLPPERTLTEEFGVNRQALREALQRLDQLGLVEIRHGGATRVRDYRHSAGLDVLPRLFLRDDGTIDVDIVRSVMEIRTAVGADAAALSAARMPAPLLDELHELVAGLAAAHHDDAARLAGIDAHFWDLVVDGSGNVCYRLSLNALRRAYQPVEPIVDRLLLDERRDLAGHHAMISAIAAGAAAAARDAAVRLLSQGGAAVLGHFRDPEPTPNPGP